ncbi:MAG: hypothetical protein AAFN42_21560 [Cyanobacteria bacterium J06554_1]
MNPSKQFHYTLDQPLAPNFPTRMQASKQQTFTESDLFRNKEFDDYIVRLSVS